MILLIAYDLHKPGQSYHTVAELIQTADSYTHPQGSVWLIDTQKNCADWRDDLKAVGDPNDEFFVVELRKHWGSSRLDRASVVWLKDSERSWT